MSLNEKLMNKKKVFEMCKVKLNIKSLSFLAKMFIFNFASQKKSDTN